MLTATLSAERLVLVVFRGNKAAPCAPRTDSTAAAAGNTPPAAGGIKHSTPLAHGTTSAFPDTAANLAAAAAGSKPLPACDSNPSTTFARDTASATSACPLRDNTSATSAPLPASARTTD